MGRGGVAVICVALSLIAPAQSGMMAAGRSCESLASLMLAGATVTSAKQVSAGAFMPAVAPGGRGAPPAAVKAYASLPSFCRVQAAAAPTPDSDIKIEV